MASRTITIRRDAGAAFRPLSREAVELALLIGLLPNLLFLLATPFYIAERMVSPLLYLVAGLVSLTLPRFLSVLLFLIVAVVDLGLIVTTTFHLKPLTAINSIRYMASIDVAASAFYLGMVGAVAGMAILTATLVGQRKQRLRSASPVPAALMAGLVMLIDWQATFPYVESKVEGAPFESAVAKSGLETEAAAGKRNLLIVMVEGMGAFANAEERAILTAPLEAAARSGGYRFERGTALYSGSTTGAESRELCGRWGDFQDYLKGGSFDCLPRRLAAQGYETIAYHGFSASMFSRGLWYPRIGFTRMHFREDIARMHGAMVPSRCGSVFNGLCDSEVGQVVREELLASSGKPKLVYWLTLNSHVPYVPVRDGRLACGRTGARIGNRTVCDLSEYWLDVTRQVAAIAADPSLPPTDILVVGDHHTPLWERAAKDRFLLNEVDWYLLRREG